MGGFLFCFQVGHKFSGVNSFLKILFETTKIVVLPFAPLALSIRMLSDWCKSFSTVWIHPSGVVCDARIENHESTSWHETAARSHCACSSITRMYSLQNMRKWRLLSKTNMIICIKLC